MRRFILRLLGLALVFTSSIGAFNLLIGWRLKDGIGYGDLSDVKFCVVGHSHPECAFNDSLIDGMKNFALSGEAYFYNYYKLESMLSKGVRLENVFIEYSNNSLSADLCEWIWDDQNLSRSYVKFSPYIDVSGNAMILRHNPKGWLNAYCLSMKWRMDQLFKSNINYLDYSGGYKFLERNELDSLMRTTVMGEANHGENLPMEVCDMNQFYLRKMIQLLKDNNCMVYLIRSPLHSLYPGYKFEMVCDSIYSRHFSDVEKLDFSKFPLTKDDYGDFEHLNHNGARMFSMAFNDMILKGLLSSPNKQQFIDEYFAAKN